MIKNLKEDDLLFEDPSFGDEIFSAFLIVVILCLFNYVIDILFENLNTMVDML